MDDARGIEDGMLDDEVGETQWTAGARASYRSATLALLEVLRRHAELVGTRAGRQAELEPYFDSVEALGSALGLFRDAEFDLTGSTPFPPLGWQDDEDEEDEGLVPLVGRRLAVVHRAEFEVLDEAGLIAAGQSVYAQAWPDDTAADARHAVTTVPAAVAELVHAHGWGVLEAGTEHLRPRSSEMSIVQDDDV